MSLFTACEPSAPAAPTQLRLSEGFENPLGFYDATPTFSWWLPGGTQSAYSIVVSDDPNSGPEEAELWRSGKVESGHSTFVAYEGPTLTSRQSIYWWVRYWNEAGEPSDWSERATAEMGLLDNVDWRGRWIGLPAPALEDTTPYGTPLFRPVYLRRDFGVGGAVESARLYITARGVYHALLNGKALTPETYMAPGWTPYAHRIETLTYDVTNAVSRGENTLGVELAEGWYAGRIGYSRSQWTNTDPPRLLAQLEVTYTDGSTQVIPTDESWKATDAGPLRFASIYDGAIYEASREMDGWAEPGFSTDGRWQPVLAEGVADSVALRPKRHHPVVVRHEVDTEKIMESDSTTIFDLGQNLVGVPRLRVPMRAGDTLVARFAEMLEANGELHTKNYRSARSTDYYIAAANGTVDWTPRHTFHGFRYVELSGFDPAAEPEADWVTGRVLYSDFSQAGKFNASDTTLNRLQSNIRWGLRGNFLDIPTDCPQRDERMGWTGDAQVFAPTSLFLEEVHSFWAAWLESMREEQLASGGIPIVIPNLAGNRVSAGWGDAATVIPWEVYRATGDENILRENYDMMRGWVNYYGTVSHDYIVDDMFAFMDWLQPYSNNGRFGDTPIELICTAYYARSVDLTRRAARVLGKAEEADRLNELLAKVKSAFYDQFFATESGADDTLATQTGHLLALAFELLPEAERERVFDRLVELVGAADGHLRTGFLGTPLILPVLDSFGRADLAYDILFKRSYPGWFYSIDQGATTMWERWNSYTRAEGVSKENMNSFNHYAYGAVGQWMYERVAGIAPLEPGYRRIRIAPRPGGPLTGAEAEHLSPYGRIAVEWGMTEDGGLTLDVTIPPNTEAEVALPVEVTNGEISISYAGQNKSPGRVVKRTGTDIGVYDVKPGTYQFSYQPN